MYSNRPLVRNSNVIQTTPYLCFDLIELQERIYAFSTRDEFSFVQGVSEIFFTPRPGAVLGHKLSKDTVIKLVLNCRSHI